MTSPFLSAADARRFVTGGRAVLTVRSQRTGEHRTYRINRREGDDGRKTPFFVSLLTGPDNTADYQYVGVLDESTGGLRLTRASRFTCDSVPVRAFDYVMKRVFRGELPADADVMHEGRCGVCARALTVPESIERGIGPECWEKLHD